MPIAGAIQGQPRTDALRRALLNVHDDMEAADLLFLENWQAQAPQGVGVGAALRASQIRRANPELATAIYNELHGRRAHN